MLVRASYHGAWITLVLLIALCVAAELWIAPGRPGGSWIVLKVIPLLLPLRGILHGRRYTFQWASMLILIYFMEGVVRAWAGQGAERFVALGETALAFTFFACAVAFAHGRAPSRNPAAANH